ncbi:hypothetical protein STRDD10_00583 [Streptococcus sp. DD10]|nr:hypothetical protein STRDD10_00583 [Streptococcus sp. DD10]
MLSVENKQETKLKLSKLNITEKIGIYVVEQELNKLGIQKKIRTLYWASLYTGTN